MENYAEDTDHLGGGQGFAKHEQSRTKRSVTGAVEMVGCRVTGAAGGTCPDEILRLLLQLSN